MAYKKKADCTPEEWEEYLQKNRVYRQIHPQQKRRKKDYTKEKWEHILQLTRDRRKKINYTKEQWEIRLSRQKKKKDYTEEEWSNILKRNRELYKIRRAKLSDEEKKKIREKNRTKKKHKQDYTQEEWNKILTKARKTKKDYSDDQWLRITENHKKVNYKKVLYKDFFDKLTIDEDPIQDKDGFLLVRDFYTKEYFYPTYRMVYDRVRCLEGKSHGEGHLYASLRSKIMCPVYNAHGRKKKIKNQARDVFWRDTVISRADGHCERCGKESDKLIAHHKVPVASCAMMATDVDNGMALCPECHKEVHSTDGCRLHELAAEKRKTA